MAGYYPQFFKQKQAQLKLQRQQKLQHPLGQLPLPPPPSISSDPNLPSSLDPLPPQLQQLSQQSYIPKAQRQVLKDSIDQIIGNGRIIKIYSDTIIENEFRVGCLYDGREYEVIATREEIITNNIGVLLSYYEKKLGCV